MIKFRIIVSISLALLVFLSCSYAFALGSVNVEYKDGHKETFGFVKKVVEVYDDFGRLQQVRIIPVQPNKGTVLNYENLRSYNVDATVEVEGLRPNYDPYYHKGPRKSPGAYTGFWSEEEYKNWKKNIIKKSR